MGDHRSIHGSPWSWISKLAEERALADGGAKLLLVYYALCRLESDAPDEAKGCFYASTNQIARHSGLSPRSVQGVLPQLEISGLATILSGRGAGIRGSHIANRYTLLEITPPYALDAYTPYATGAYAHTQISHEIFADNKELEEQKEIEGVDDEKPKRLKSSLIQLPPIPVELDTPAFRIIWDEWIQHRKDKKKGLTATTATKQLKQLSAWGSEKATAALDKAIHEGWQGFYEPKEFFPTNDQSVPSLPKSKEPENWVPVFEQLYPNGKSMPWDQLAQLHPDIADEVKAITDQQPLSTSTSQNAP